MCPGCLLEETKKLVGKELDFKLDVKTRWGSMYDMLARFLLLKDAVMAACKKLDGEKRAIPSPYLMMNWQCYKTCVIA